jgi:Predicted transcriptional regulators
MAMMSEGEITVGEFTDILGESQPKISRHLAYLRSAGLVATRRDGKRIYYRITEPDNAGIAAILSTTLRCVASQNDTAAARKPSFNVEQSHEAVISRDTYISEPTQGELEIHLL